MNKEIVPTISVVVPSYNQGEYLSACLDSLLLQNYPALEIIVADGGSADNSRRILEQYSDKLALWRSEPDGGQAAAISWGFQEASGDILCWLNSDDILFPGTLWQVSTVLSDHRELNAVYCDRAVISANDEVIGFNVCHSRLYPSDWYKHQPVAQEGCFWRASVYHKLGGVDPGLRFVMDYDLLYRVWREAPEKFAKIDMVAGALRVHERAKNSTMRDIWAEEVEVVTARYGIALESRLRLGLRRRLRAANHLRIEAFYNRHAPLFESYVKWVRRLGLSGTHSS